MARLDEVITAVEGWFEPRLAEDWDAIGLVCGDPRDRVERILLAVDAVPATVTEAVERGAQLLLTHHPLLLSGVHSVATDTAKGALIHRLIRSGIALYVAHTNADNANPGVSDALATLLGLTELRPLEPIAAPALDKLVVFVPAGSAPALIDALAAAGAGQLGHYDRCAWTGLGEGTFRARAGANPTIGAPGEITTVAEARVEMVLAPTRRGPVIEALRRAHPYEEPAFDLLPMAPRPSNQGAGRIGQLAAPMTLAAFTAHAASVLPATVGGLRTAGDPAQLLRTVAVCGGAGASLIGAARAAGADAYLTADLKHHQTSEATAELADISAAAPMALIDAAHWATESPFLHALADALRERFGTTVDPPEILVSTQVTDPWRLHVPSSESSSSTQ